MSQAAERLDLKLANWFRGEPIDPGEDSVWKIFKIKILKILAL